MSAERPADVRLRALVAEDAERILGWLRDPEIADGLGLRREPSLAYTQDWLQRIADDAGDTVARAVIAGGEHVGNVVLDRIDRGLGLARFSIYLAARGRGVGTRATRAMLDLAFGELGLRKVWLEVHEHNDRAIAAYRSAGFREEGRLREEFLLGRSFVDAIRMGVLATDARGVGA